MPEHILHSNHFLGKNKATNPTNSGPVIKSNTPISNDSILVLPLTIFDNIESQANKEHERPYDHEN